MDSARLAGEPKALTVCVRADDPEPAKPLAPE
jgi:hypothetical protein